MLKKLAVAVATAGLMVLSAVTPAYAAPTVYAPIGFETGPYNYVAVSNDGSLIAAVSDSSEEVHIVNVADQTSRVIDLVAGDYGYPAFSNDNAFLYIPNYGESGIDVLDLSTGAILRSIPGIADAWVVELSKDGDTLFARSYGDLELSKISLADDTVTGPLMLTGSTAGASAQPMCLSLDGSKLFAGNAQDAVDVIDLSTWTLETSIDVTIDSVDTEPLGCETDNDGNVIVALDATGGVGKIAPDGSFAWSGNDFVDNEVAAVPSCDKIFIGDFVTGGYLAVLEIATLDPESDLTIPEAGSGWYAYSGDRSADGSVVAFGGQNVSDALAVVVTPECVVASEPALPNTGVNTLAVAAAGAFALLALAAGAFVLVARRRKA